LNKLKQRENNIEGTRQNSFVTLGEGMFFKFYLKISIKERATTVY